MHNSFAKGKVICKCKNDKPWKKEIGKASPPPLLRRPTPGPYLHPLFKIFQIPPSGEDNQNLLPTPFKKRESRGGGPNYA